MRAGDTRRSFGGELFLLLGEHESPWPRRRWALDLWTGEKTRLDEKVLLHDTRPLE